MRSCNKLVVLRLRTMQTRGGRAVRIPRSIWEMWNDSRERKLRWVPARWSLFCTLVLRSPFQRFGNRCLAISFLAKALTFWHSLIAKQSVTYPEETRLYEADPLLLSLHHICDEGYHVWGLEHVLRNFFFVVMFTSREYLNVSASSSLCLQSISRHAPAILAAYHGRRLDAFAIQRFIQIISWRRNSILRIRQGTSVTSLHGRLYFKNSDMTDGASSSTTH